MSALDEDRTGLSSEEILSVKARKLHVQLLFAIGVMAVVYSGLNFYYGMYEHCKITLAVIPGVFIAWLLNRANYFYWSKVWNFLLINVTIFLLAKYSQKETYLFVFYLPIIVGSLIVFQGKERYTGYLFTLISCVAIALIVFWDSNILLYKNNEVTNPTAGRIMNVFGVVASLILEVIFILKTNREVQNNLIKKQEMLDLNVERLKASLYSRNRMIAILAHDVRAPLNIIEGYLDQLRDDQIHEGMKRQVTELLYSRAVATNRLLVDMVKWAQSQGDTIQWSPEKITLSELKRMIEVICESSVQGICTEQFAIIVEETDDKWIIADRNMMDAIFRNLLSNAIKFTSDDRKINIEVLVQGDIGCFAVQDNGSGISPDNLEKLRKGISFSTAESINVEGMGLGNTIVVDFLKHHDSQLYIQSDVGAGSRFYFYLPVMSA
jgi:signal transduction histidine kinase